MKLISLLLALMVTSSPLPVFAQLEHSDQSLEPRDRILKKHRGHHRGIKERAIMKRIDTNQDGKIDLTEYLTTAEQRFQAMDSDGNGFVNPDEMREHSKEMRRKHRKAMKAARKAYRESKDSSYDAE